MLDFEWQSHEVVAAGRTTREAINEIQKWLKGSKFPKLSEEQIVLFLLSCNNDVPATQTTITAYYKVRHHNPNLFNDRDVETDELQHVQRVGCFGMLPKRTADGSAIIFHRLRDTTYWKYNIEPSMKLLFMCLDFVSIGDSPPTGLICIFDMKGVGLMHLTRIKLGAVRAFFQYLQEGLPIQLKEIHVFNVVYFFDKIMAIIKPFMKKELMDMLNLHQPGMDMEQFFKKYVPKDCIPSDYEGTSLSVEELHSSTIAQMINKKKFFKDEEEQRKQYKP